VHEGFTKAYRKELDSQVWLMSPIYHRVWFVLRQKAKYCPCSFPTPNKFEIHINPGQLITSIDQICKWTSWTEWGREKIPNKKTVKVVLDWLESNGMITVTSNGKGTFINITNWHIYNHVPDDKVTQSNHEFETQEKRLLETIKELNREVQELKEKKDKNNMSEYSDRFLSFWKAYPKKTGKKKCYAVWKKNKCENGHFDEIMAAIESQIKWRAEARGQFIPEWKNPETWLNKGCWEDEPGGGEEENQWR